MRYAKLYNDESCIWKKRYKKGKTKLFVTIKFKYDILKTTIMFAAEKLKLYMKLN